MKVLLYVLCGVIVSAIVLLATSLYVALWPPEVYVSMTPQVLVVIGSMLGASGAVLVYVRRRVSLALVRWYMVGLVVWAYCLSSAIQPVPQMAQARADTITIATYNARFTTSDFTASARYIIDNNVDIVALQEVTPNKVAYISRHTGLTHAYIAQHQPQRQGSTALLSRYPLSDARTTPLAYGYGVVRARVALPTGDIAIYSLHLVLPYSPGRYVSSRTQLTETLPALLRDEPLPAIVAGDFNATPYTPRFTSFANQTEGKLQYALSRPLPQCSWFGYSAALCMRIDHTFYPRDATLHDVTISPHLESDHRMVIVTLYI